MNLKVTIKRLRSNYYISAVLVFFATPVFRFSSYLIKAIPKRIRVNGKTVLYQNMSMNFPKNIGLSILGKLYWRGPEGYEPMIGKIIMSLSRNHQLFMDIGSNIGLYSVVAQKSNPEIFAHCFEPVSSLVIKNKKFQEANGVKNYHIHQLGLSSVLGKHSIFIPSGDEYQETSTSSLTPSFSYNQNLSGSTDEIETTTLDAFFEKLPENLRKNSFFKIDVEGHEIEVLKGGMKVLHDYCPIIILELECIADNMNFLASLFNTIPYRIFEITESVLIQESIKNLLPNGQVNNFLLLPENAGVSLMTLVHKTDVENWLSGNI